MTQDPKDNSSFAVSAGEQVTVTLQAVQCNCMTSAGFDGQTLAQQSSIPDVYSFQVNGNSGDGKLFVGVCQFTISDPVTAHYTVKVAASGGSFTSSPQYKQVPPKVFQLYFAIA